MTRTEHWHQRIGFQRDWVWRGWQTRYTFIRSDQANLDSPPVILLHGFGTSIEHWRQTIPVLQPHHTVYALDLLGFGASRKAETNYNIELWVEQLYEFWQIFIGQPVVLVGNSLGSLTALATAHFHPEMVTGLVLLSLPDLSLRQEAIPKRIQPVVRALENAFTSPLVLHSLFKLVRRPAIIRRWVGLAYANSEAVTEELVDILSSPTLDEGSDFAFSALFQGMMDPKFSPIIKDILPTLSIPILLIWGRCDKMIPIELAHHFTCLNPQIDLVEVEAGHCPHDECPEILNPILLSWLKNYLNPKLATVASSQK